VHHFFRINPKVFITFISLFYKVAQRVLPFVTAFAGSDPAKALPKAKMPVASLVI